jgi:hypothetical protein
MTAAAPVGVVELLGRDGRVQWVQRITTWPARIGRSPACEVVLDDVHVAAEHAELDWSAPGALSLRLLPSLNGAWLDDTRLSAGDTATLRAGQELSLGGCRLRVRHSAEPLPPERHLLIATQRHWAVLPGLMALMLVLLWLDRWTAVDPDARWFDYAWPLLGPLAFALGWAGMWALATQLFQHRFPFATHLRKVLAAICALGLLEWLVPLLGFAFSWPRLTAFEALATPVVGAGLVWWHASVVWPGVRRLLGIGVAALLVVGLGLQAAGRQEQQYVFGAPYLASIAPPGVRLVAAKPTRALIESLKPLKDELARQARKDNEGQETEAMEGGE